MAPVAIAQPATTAPTTSPASARPTTRRSSMAASIDRWIEQLADPSPEKRDAAASQLRRVSAAREALMAAAESPNVQRRTLARQILSDLPLYDSDSDPPQVREPLRQYQRADVATRPLIALKLLAATTPPTDSGFARILASERNVNVLWAIVARISPQDRDRLYRGPLAKIDLSRDVSPPTRLLIAMAMDASRDKSAPLDGTVAEQFQRVLDDLTSVPATADSLVAQAAEALCSAARAANDGAREIAIRRHVAVLTPPVLDADESPDVPQIIAGLDQQLDQLNGGDDALEGLATTPEPLPRLGPAIERYLATRLRLHDGKDVASDLAAFGVAEDHPAARLALALLDRKTPLTTPATRPGGSPELAADLRPAVAALVERDPAALQRLLVRLGQDAGELKAADAIAAHALKILEAQRTATGLKQREPLVSSFERMRLGLVRLKAALAAGDTTAIAEARQIARTVTVEPPEKHELAGVWYVEQAGDLLARSLIDEARRAEREGDQAIFESALDALARVSPMSSASTMDAVYLLETNGRLTEADEVFAEQLARERAALDEQETETTLNGVAWLCARTGRDVERAYRYAVRANEISPDVSSMLDTQAEAAFRTNRVDEAIRLETKALQLSRGDRVRNLPSDDKFLVAQLARFRAGLKPGDESRPLPSEGWDGLSDDE